MHHCPICKKEWNPDYYKNAQVYCLDCAMKNTKEVREKHKNKLAKQGFPTTADMKKHILNVCTLQQQIRECK